MKKQQNLYVAYGSNLNLRQMKYRCPEARLYKIGTLENYALEFRGMPDHAYATITPKEGSSVPVAVWKISPQDERNLDVYEGYPRHYFKEQVAVDIGGMKVEAMVYRMNLEAKFGLPSSSYYQTVLQGYRSCGLDTDVLAEALKISAHAFFQSQRETQTNEQSESGQPECVMEEAESSLQEGMQL